MMMNETRMNETPAWRFVFRKHFRKFCAAEPRRLSAKRGCGGIVLCRSFSRAGKPVRLEGKVDGPDYRAVLEETRS